MKATFTKLAAAAVVSAAIAGGAASANAATPAVADLGALPNASTSGVEKVVYFPRYGKRSCRRLYRLAFYHGSRWAKRMYYRYCVGRPHVSY